MALTAEQDTYFRARLGSGYDDSDAEERLTRITADDPDADNPEALVAVEVLSQRLADLSTKPSQFAVDGYSENRAANMSLIERMLVTAREEAGVGATGTETRIVMPRPWGYLPFHLDSEEMTVRRRRYSGDSYCGEGR